MCEKRVSTRSKIYDCKCPGLYVSIPTAGVATFAFKFSDGDIGKQRTMQIGVYNPEIFTADDARSEVCALKALGPAKLVERLRKSKAAKGKHGKTVAEIIELRIDWIKQKELKADREMRPRIESWGNVASYLRRLAKPKLGRMIASDVTRDDIAELSNDILEGKYGKPSVSNTRHMRRAVSAPHKWAGEAGRNYVPETCRPCFNRLKLPTEHARERVLTEDEIRTLWHGLDCEALPWDRKTRLAIKFELVTMLRTKKLRAAHRDELIGLNGDSPLIRIPAERVKKRRVIEQPLSSLAIEIIKEVLASDDQQFIFESPIYPGQPIHRIALATALRGIKHEKNTDKSKKPGLCELLGLRPFTPHDLRCTAATLAGELGYSDAAIAKCLDHQVSKDDGEKVARVTGVYVRSKRMDQKRAVLDGVADALRKIITTPAAPGLRLVA
jgi:integrase